MNKDTLKEFKSYLWKRWILDVCVRTVKTGAETAAGMITVGAMVSDINWIRVLSVSGREPSMETTIKTVKLTRGGQELI